MKCDYSYLQFCYYQYEDTDALAEALLKKAEAGEKSAIFVRNKLRGQELAEKLSDSIFVYASDTREELEQIAQTERYEETTLISTKVLDNGVSILDDDVKHMVIEEIDPIALIQMLGRIRISRKKPRTICLWLPDYSRQQLNQMRHNFLELLSSLREIQNDFTAFFKHTEQLQPWMICSENKKIHVNTLAIIKLSHLVDHIDYLMEQELEAPHAHIRFIRELLDRSAEPDEKDFLGYDDVIAFRSKVTAAFEQFAVSPMYKADRERLGNELVQAVRTTSVYPKNMTSNSIQIGTINAILDYAGISAKIRSLGETYGIEYNSSS